eukprot:GHVT01088298.1.p1 GENE.GHVT01088298.1~~GHVT01088298.1.p1  ORF type:complete len:650 (-),score=37.05 GHVT01088298.1:1342-3291(-)
MPRPNSRNAESHIMSSSINLNGQPIFSTNENQESLNHGGSLLSPTSHGGVSCSYPGSVEVRNTSCPDNAFPLLSTSTGYRLPCLASPNLYHEQSYDTVDLSTKLDTNPLLACLTRVANNVQEYHDTHKILEDEAQPQQATTWETLYEPNTGVCKGFSWTQLLAAMTRTAGNLKKSGVSDGDILIVRHSSSVVQYVARLAAFLLGVCVTDIPRNGDPRATCSDQGCPDNDKSSTAGSATVAQESPISAHMEFFSHLAGRGKIFFLCDDASNTNGADNSSLENVCGVTASFLDPVVVDTSGNMPSPDSRFPPQTLEQYANCDSNGHLTTFRAVWEEAQTTAALLPTPEQLLPSVVVQVYHDALANSRLGVLLGLFIRGLPSRIVTNAVPTMASQKGYAYLCVLLNDSKNQQATSFVIHYTDRQAMDVTSSNDIDTKEGARNENTPRRSGLAFVRRHVSDSTGDVELEVRASLCHHSDDKEEAGEILEGIVGVDPSVTPSGATANYSFQAAEISDCLSAVLFFCDVAWSDSKSTSGFQSSLHASVPPCTPSLSRLASPGTSSTATQQLAAPIAWRLLSVHRVSTNHPRGLQSNEVVAAMAGAMTPLLGVMTPLLQRLSPSCPQCQAESTLHNALRECLGDIDMPDYNVRTSQ